MHLFFVQLEKSEHLGDSFFLCSTILIGPKSKEVVEFARHHGFLAVVGNHDDWVLFQRHQRQLAKQCQQNPSEQSDELQKYAWTDVSWLSFFFSSSSSCSSPALSSVVIE
jgi:hypothetical protein